MTNEELKYYSHPKMQEKFREAMGECKQGDWYIYKGKKHLADTDTLANIITRTSNALRLPLPIDPVNPERGLWGMVDSLSSVHLNFDNPELPWMVWTQVKEKDFVVQVYEGETITLALLYALAHQWEVKR